MDTGATQAAAASENYVSYSTSESRADIKRRFTHHPPRNDADVHQHESVRLAMMEVALDVDEKMPPSREKSLAITKLEEAMMWANAGLARSRADG